MLSFSRPIFIDINKGLEELKNIPNAVLVDVRTPEEFKQGHIESSINIPLSQLEDISEITDDNLEIPIALYCRTGNRAVQALEELKELGYTNVASIGGIEKFKGKTIK